MLWFNKAFIYIAAMKSCHQVTERGSYWVGLADVAGTTAPLCLLFLFLVPDLASLVSFRFLFPLVLSCFPCSSFFFLFPAVKQRAGVRFPAGQVCPAGSCGLLAWFKGWLSPFQPHRCPPAGLLFVLRAVPKYTHGRWLKPGFSCAFPSLWQEI